MIDIYTAQGLGGVGHDVAGVGKPTRLYFLYFTTTVPVQVLIPYLVEYLPNSVVFLFSLHQLLFCFFLFVREIEGSLYYVILLF